jgi:DNA mismatch endonuclease, patch repair protein
MSPAVNDVVADSGSQHPTCRVLDVTDVMSREKRSELMSRIRSKNSGIERIVFRSLRRRRVHFSKHVDSLPGKPDVVFKQLKIAVFVDSDFWHGWRFPLWRERLQPYWKEKIARNRQRDQRNFRRLRRMSWTVIRIWEHDIRNDLTAVIDEVLRARKEAIAKKPRYRRSSRSG